MTYDLNFRDTSQRYEEFAQGCYIVALIEPVNLLTISQMHKPLVHCAIAVSLTIDFITHIQTPLLMHMQTT